MKGDKTAKKAQPKETATITVRLFPSTHKVLKVKAATAQCSVARYIDTLAKGA